MIVGKEPVFAPREDFEAILKYGVIPTFDLIIELPNNKGIVLVKRKIPPYFSKWALPGLRMYKNESIDDTLVRIAEKEVRVGIDTSKKRFLGQYVGRFKTEFERQDLSTGYVVPAIHDNPIQNGEHFSDMKIITSLDEVPEAIGAMYLYYLKLYFGEPA